MIQTGSISMKVERSRYNIQSNWKWWIIYVWNGCVCFELHKGSSKFGIFVRNPRVNHTIFMTRKWVFIFIFNDLSTLSPSAWRCHSEGGVCGIFSLFVNIFYTYVKFHRDYKCRVSLCLALCVEDRCSTHI